MATVTERVRLDDGEHVVHFYNDEPDLVDVVVGYLAAALRDGDAVVMVADAGHISAFDAALTAAGVRAPAMAAEGRLVVLDAHDVLAAIMRGDAADPREFDAVVGETVRRLATAGRRVRAYGELVALLWGQRNEAAAVEIERLWNQLGESTPLSLFCAYPVHDLASAASADALADVCALHSSVVAGAPIPAGHEISRRFLLTQHAPKLARNFVRQTLSDWGLHTLVDDASIVVSELATNATTHAASDLTVSMSRTPTGVRVAVADRSTLPPAQRRPERHEMSGRGLGLIDAIAEEWGHVVSDDHKIVWVDLAVQAPAGDD